MVSNDWMVGVMGDLEAEAKDPLEQHCRDCVDKTWNFAGKLKTDQDHVVNAVMGLAGEAGEILEFHKKILFHNPKHATPEDALQDLKEELGDLCYYLSKVMDLYGFTLEDVLATNKAKLFARHSKDGKED